MSLLFNAGVPKLLCSDCKRQVTPSRDLLRHTRVKQIRTCDLRCLGFYAPQNGSLLSTFCPETSIINYKSTLRKIPEERRSHLHRGGSLESRKSKCPFVVTCRLPLGLRISHFPINVAQWAVCLLWFACFVYATYTNIIKSYYYYYHHYLHIIIIFISSSSFW